MVISKILPLFGVSLVLASVAWGRIGETLADCKVRYGKINDIHHWDDKLTYFCFTKGSIDVRVGLLQGKVVDIQYVLRNETGETVPFPQSELEFLMAKNAPNQDWRLDSIRYRGGGVTRFRNKASNLIAVIGSDYSSLQIAYRPWYDEFMKDKMVDQKEMDRHGF